MNNKREKVNYKCCICGKELWTLRQNFIGEGVQKCPICKRREKNAGNGSEKRKQTMLKKYGTTCFNNQEKAKQTRLEKNKGSYFSAEQKFQISQTLKNKSVEERSRINTQKVETQLNNNNGVYFSENSKKNIGNWTKTDEGKEKLKNIKLKNCFNHRNSIEHIEYEKNIIKSRGYELVSTQIDKNNNETYFVIKCNECGEQFKWYMIGDTYRPYCKKCFKAPFSKLEKELANYISSFINIEENNRTILNGKELDIFIPTKNIAFEFDGIYWHNNKNNSFKYEECKKKNIRLIRITESDWKRNNEKIKYYIKSMLGIYDEKIQARKCIIKEITTKEYKDFVNKNHLQEYVPASVRIGLFYNNELIEVEGFSKARFSKKYEWELSRECSKNGVQIIGGKSKLLKYFERKYTPKSLLSYCEKDKFSGVSYEKCGFILDHESPPNYMYYKNSYEPMSRLRFQKSKLKKLFSDYNDDLSEWENMDAHGYMRLFDYGQYVFIKNY